jgi:hypothetical protein
VGSANRKAKELEQTTNDSVTTNQTVATTTNGTVDATTNQTVGRTILPKQEPNKNNNTLSETSSEGDVPANSSFVVESPKQAKGDSARPPQASQEVIPPAPAKTPDWQARPWLYGDVPLSEETYNGLSERDKHTAILAMICWHVSHTKPANGEGVHKRLQGSWESKVLKAMKLVEGRTPQTLATWAKAYRADQYGSQTASPDVLAQRYAQWLAGNQQARPTPKGEWQDWMAY